jgi:hypothetical protein
LEFGKRRERKRFSIRERKKAAEVSREREKERKKTREKEKLPLTFGLRDDPVPLAPLVLDPGKHAKGQEEEPAAPESESEWGFVRGSFEKGSERVSVTDSREGEGEGRVTEGAAEQQPFSISQHNAHLSSALVQRARSGLSGSPRSLPATSRQKAPWTHGRISAVRRSLHSKRGTPRSRSRRRSLASSGEERSVHGLLRAKEAETARAGPGGGAAGVFEVDVPAVVAAAANGVPAFLSPT